MCQKLSEKIIQIKAEMCDVGKQRGHKTPPVMGYLKISMKFKILWCRCLKKEKKEREKGQINYTRSGTAYNYSREQQLGRTGTCYVTIRDEAITAGLDTHLCNKKDDAEE